MHIDQLLTYLEKEKGSDLHITVSSPPMMRVHGRLTPIGNVVVTHEMAEVLVKQISTPERFKEFVEVGESDFSYTTQLGTRFRVNIYKQRGHYGIAARIITTTIPKAEELGLPAVYETLVCKHKGLVLITGPTGSGKSTTLASMMDYINTHRSEHIITVEDPIEYVHKNKMSIVNQREVGADTRSFNNALRAALREDPDVILIGEMRDMETIEIALTAAETGHLVFSTLHTVSAPKTIDRIVGIFPAEKQDVIRTQLSGVLEAVISQQLLPKTGGNGRIAAFEVMTKTPAISNLIREGKIHQIYSTMQTSAQFGMNLMDKALSDIVRSGAVDFETALEYSVDPENFKKNK